MAEKPGKKDTALKAKKLTPKQQLFVREYLKDLNATQAAIRAKYSKKTANRIASQLLSNLVIRKTIEKHQAQLIEKVEVDADWVVKRLRIEALGEGPDTNSSARVRASELLGKHQAMFIDKLEHSGKVNLDSIIITRKDEKNE